MALYKYVYYHCYDEYVIRSLVDIVPTKEDNTHNDLGMGISIKANRSKTELNKEKQIYIFKNCSLSID